MTILFGTDLSDESEPVGDVAAALTVGSEKLLIVHIAAEPPSPAHHELINRLARRLSIGGRVVESLLESKAPVGERLAELADDVNASLIVVGAQGRGRRPLLGSVAATALRRSRAPILVVRGAPKLAERLGDRVAALVAMDLENVDGSLRDATALIAACCPVDATLAHYREPSANGPAPDLCAAFGDPPARVHLSSVVRHHFGSIAGHVQSLAGELHADLVICGSQRRTGLDRALQGSVAAGIVRHAAVSVLVAAAPR